MLYQATLVCEGGAMAGVYTAGVLDVLMEKDVALTHAIGVSVGACNACGFASRQIGRTISCIAVKDRKLAYMGPRCLLRRHKFYDFELCFEEFADRYFPFDYEAFENSPVRVEVVATDCKTGKPVYIHCTSQNKQVVYASRASASLPFFSPIYEFQGISCLDGSVTRSIPIERAISYGNEKIVVISTKAPGYRMSPNTRLQKRLINRVYGDYPKLRKAMRNRYREYNKTADRIDEMEREGKIFVFRPAVQLVTRHETNYNKLRQGYDEGLADGNCRYEELLAYLEK